MIWLRLVMRVGQLFGDQFLLELHGFRRADALDLFHLVQRFHLLAEVPRSGDLGSFQIESARRCEFPFRAARFLSDTSPRPY